MSFNADYGIFITTSYFTKQAQSKAVQGGNIVTLIDGQRLVELIEKYQLYITSVKTYVRAVEWSPGRDRKFFCWRMGIYLFICSYIERVVPIKVVIDLKIYYDKGSGVDSDMKEFNRLNQEISQKEMLLPA